MSVGPGKYDDILTLAMADSRAAAAILVIIEGHRGSGFGVQCTPGWEIDIPRLLRTMADQIEKDAAQIEEAR